MGLFDFIFKNQPTPQIKTVDSFYQTLTAYSPTFYQSPASAYEVDMIRASIHARAKAMSKLKVEFIGNAKGKLKSRCMAGPNSFMTWSQFLYRTSTILDMQNNVFIVPLYDEFGTISGFYPILPSLCELVEHAGQPWIRYSFQNGKKAAMPISDIALMTKFQYDDDFFGSSNQRAIKDILELNSIQSTGIREAVKNSNTYRFFGQLKNFAKQEDITAEQKRFNDAAFKAENDAGGGVLLFPNTYGDIKQMTSQPYTVQPEEMVQLQTRIYNLYGTNEDIVQNKAFGDSWAAFYEGEIEPFAVQMSETMTKLVYTLTEITYGNKVMLTANRLQYMSTNEKLNVVVQLTDRGLLTRNDAREIFNLPPVEGGDKLIIRGEYYNLDAEGNKVDQIIKEGGTENAEE